MRVVLKPHPDTPCEAVTEFDVEVERDGASLSLCYHLVGDVGGLVVAPPAPGGRTDGLWRSTCFEAFVRPGMGPYYIELNAAPSGRWASYAFDDYRAGVIDAEGVTPGPVDLGGSDRRLILKVAFDGLPADADWTLGVSAVVEAAGGKKSYWALAHPKGKPDFHHNDGFVLDLPADSQ
jgi:hypothetical protein